MVSWITMPRFSYRTTSCNESSSEFRVATIQVVPDFRAVTVAARMPTGDIGRERCADGRIRSGARERDNLTTERVESVGPHGPRRTC